MARHAETFLGLTALGEPYCIEGKIWLPDHLTPPVLSVEAATVARATQPAPPSRSRSRRRFPSYVVRGGGSARPGPQDWTGDVPEVSRFFGIVIRMFVEVGTPHHRPHFHAAFAEHASVYSIDPVERLAGDLPRSQERLVLAWAEIHRQELAANWQALQVGRSPSRIEPLR